MAAIGKHTLSIPFTQHALLVKATGQHVFSYIAIPKLTPTTILIEVRAVAVNPVDAKMVDLHGSSLNDCVGGYDLAGYVFEIGSEVDTARNGLINRCRVAGLVFGGNPLQPSVGAYCQYVLADPRFVLRIPDKMSFEQAASLGIAVATTGMALYQSLGLRMPSETPREKTTTSLSKDEWVLVLGGSSAIGTMAIRMLKLAGYKVITTAAPQNYALAQSYGADSVVDYHASTCVHDIRTQTNNTLPLVLDCVSEGDSMKTCYEAIGSNGGKYTALNPFPIQLHTRNDIKPHWVFILTMFGQPINVKGPFRRPKVRAKDVDFEAQWFHRVQILLDNDMIQTHPIEVNEKGLEALSEGVDRVRLGKVSGKKLVYVV